MAATVRTGIERKWIMVYSGQAWFGNSKTWRALDFRWFLIIIILNLPKGLWADITN